jgi:hypothetical protein
MLPARPTTFGNLPASSTSPGTWVRFSPKGTNLLGENHEQITLEDVIPAVGSTSFIFEPFSTDVLTPGSAMEKAYDLETKDRFAHLGVAGVADKRQFGAESLYPKMGFALTLLLPFFTGSDPLEGLKPGGFVGKPTQRYLRMAWGHARDVADEVATLTSAKKAVPTQLKKLAKAFNAAKGDLDTFIAGLPIQGFLGSVLHNDLAQRPTVPRTRRAGPVVCRHRGRRHGSAPLRAGASHHGGSDGCLECGATPA